MLIWDWRRDADSRLIRALPSSSRDICELPPLVLTEQVWKAVNYRPYSFPSWIQRWYINHCKREGPAYRPGQTDLLSLRTGTVSVLWDASEMMKHYWRGSRLDTCSLLTSGMYPHIELHSVRTKDSLATLSKRLNWSKIFRKLGAIKFPYKIKIIFSGIHGLHNI